MAKETKIQPADEAPKPDPTLRVSWPEGMKPGAKGIELGQRVRMVIEGEVCGFSDAEYGGSIELKKPSMTCEACGGGKMAEHIQALKKKGA